MIKNAFISGISQEEKRGSLEFQIISLNNKIIKISSHLELHRKDYLSQRGLRKIIEKQKRLLSYLSKTNSVGYKKLISQLGIRDRLNRN
jgi:small subunit ribosomal protein S15